MSALHQIEDENTYSNWKERALPAYDDAGTENFLDDDGNLIEGIYLDMPNDVYHSLPALSSSKLKDFVKSPALYYRNYVSDIERKRTTAMKNTFDAGTHGHTLVLEPQGYYKNFFRDLMPSDMPEALNTTKEIDEKLVELKLKKTGLKSEKAQRLAEKLEEIGSDIKVFDVERQKHLESHGQPANGKWEGEDVVTYGGVIPVDPMVWDDAHRVKNTTRNHREADNYFQMGLPEVTIIARCPMTGLMLKVKFDWLRFDDIAVDLKTTLSTKPEKFIRQINDLHYDVQQAFYMYVARLSDITISEFVFVATEYVNMDACQPYRLSEKREKIAHSKVQKALPELKECIDSNKWHGWLKEDCTLIIE